MGLGGIIKANRVLTTPEMESLKGAMIQTQNNDVVFEPFIEDLLRKKILAYKDTARRLRDDIPKDGLTIIDAYNKGMLYELDQVIADLESMLK